MTTPQSGAVLHLLSPVSRQELTETYNVQDRALTIKEIVKETAMQAPWPFSISDAEWHSNNPDPTAYELFHQWTSENNKIFTDLSDQNNVWYEPKIEVDNVYLDDAGEQRNQLKDPETARNVMNNAVNFQFTRALVWLALIDIPGNPFNGKYKVMDGGGTLCSASLRNIKYIGAIVVRITNESELGKNFFELAQSRKSVRGEDTFKHKLVMGDPLALLQHKLYRETDTTIYENVPNKSLKHLPLTAQKKMIIEKFTAVDDTSISGDTVDQVNDEDLFSTRSCENITDVIHALHSIYKDETKIVPAVFKEVTRWYASVNSLVTYTQMYKMLEDYKDGRITIQNKFLSSGNKVEYRVHPNAKSGELDFSTMSAMRDSLDLQTQTEGSKMYGTYVFSKLWNHWAKENRGITKIQDAWLERRLEQGKSTAFRYNPAINYDKEFKEADKRQKSI
jgi:hypothetical protein